jgi:hypothetical protein
MTPNDKGLIASIISILLCPGKKEYPLYDHDRTNPTSTHLILISESSKNDAA